MALTAGSADFDLVDSGRASTPVDLSPMWLTRTAGSSGSTRSTRSSCSRSSSGNMTAPFILISRLRRAMADSPARRTYVVNVSAMEGQFSRGYKGPGHPHTNMAKAALNMLTRTSAQEMLEADGILMTAVDTGWITDERPHPMKKRPADDGFHAPLDLVDGAAGSTTRSSAAKKAKTSTESSLKDYKAAFAPGDLRLRARWTSLP